MKIVTWNVNSIRARLARTLALLERHQPDLLCLQETKVTDELFPWAEVERLGYHAQHLGQRGYNGVALLSRQPLADVTRGFAGDPTDQARVISGEIEGLRVTNLYVVNGEAVSSPKYEVKLAWLAALAEWLRSEHDPTKPHLLVGDFNIAPEDRDIHDPELWRGRVLASDPERERLRSILGWGTTDLLRLRSAESGIHTWWDYQQGAFHRGWGLRIDLALGTSPVAERLTRVSIDREERKPTSGEGKPSDHAPVIVELA